VFGPATHVEYLEQVGMASLMALSEY